MTNSNLEELWQKVTRPEHQEVRNLIVKYAGELLAYKRENFFGEFAKLTTELYKTPLPDDVINYLNEQRAYGYLYKTKITLRDFIDKNNNYFNTNWDYWTAVNQTIYQFHNAHYEFEKYIREMRVYIEKAEHERRIAHEEWVRKQPERDAERARAELLKKSIEEQKILDEAKARLAREEFEKKVKAKMDELRTLS